tara:strand:- start:142 stop:762 length:621 start_codon:yes stop_codon:yes gene_type:complete
VKLLSIIIAIGFCFVAAKAEAQYYFEGNVGVSILRDADVDSEGSPFRQRFDDGVVVTAALGYSFGAYRFEGEVSYRKNDSVEVEDMSDGTVQVVDGDFSARSIMGNAWRDFQINPNWGVSLGGGLGLASMNNVVTSVGNTITNGDFSENVFAYQAGGGLSYEWIPETKLTFQYRLFGTEQVDFTGDGGDKYDYLSHSLMLGIRRNF